MINHRMWKEYKLIDLLVSLESGGRPKSDRVINEGIPSIGGEHINRSGRISLENLRYIPNEYFKSMRRGKIEKEDVLIVKDGATTGKVAFVDESFPFTEASVNEHVFICRANKDLIDPKYLFYHSFSSYGQRQIKQSFHGSAQGGINTNFANAYTIPVPPLETQRKIVSILDEAEEMQQLRADSDKLIQQLTQNVFLKIFGDPLLNEKGWKIEKVKNVCDEIYRYPTFYGFKYNDVGVRIIRIGNIDDNGFLDSEESCYVHIADDVNTKFHRTVIQHNDILMAVRGDGSAGKTIGIVNNKSLVNSNISPNLLRIKVNEKIINPFYLFTLLRSPSGQKIIEKNITRTAKKTITAEKIKEIEIPVPDIDLQNYFCKIAYCIFDINSENKLSSQAIKQLYYTLLNKAFIGELIS